MVRVGWNATDAINAVIEHYGMSLLPSKILEAMRKDDRNGTYPAKFDLNRTNNS